MSAGTFFNLKQMYKKKDTEETKTMRQEFLKYVLQNIAAMIGVSVYILADTFFISASAGADGITVLNLVLPVYGLIFAVGSMIGVGSATRYALGKAVGQEAVESYFLHAVFWDLMASLPFVLAGIFAPDQVLRIMGGDAGIVELGVPYTRIVLIAAPVFMINYVFTAFARNDHAPTVAMLASLSGSMFNIVFDYILMFPLHMGMTGAALATALSPVVTMMICCIHYFSRKNTVGFHWKTPSLRRILSCCELGVSGFVGEISSAVTTTVFNMLLLNIVGNIGVAAYGVVANLSLVAMSIFNGIAQGTQPLISRSFGHGESQQVKKLLRWSLYVTLIAEMLIVGFAWGFTDTFVQIFNSEGNQELRYYAYFAMRYYFLGFLAAGINIMLISYYSAIDRAKPAFAASLLRGAAAIVVCAIVMAKVWGINGVWLSFLAAEVVTLAAIWLMDHKTGEQNGVNVSSL